MPLANQFLKESTQKKRENFLRTQTNKKKEISYWFTFPKKKIFSQTWLVCSHALGVTLDSLQN